MREPASSMIRARIDRCPSSLGLLPNGASQANVKQTHPFKRLAYVYVGTTDYNADHRFYEEVLRARKV